MSFRLQFSSVLLKFIQITFGEILSLRIVKKIAHYLPPKYAFSLSYLCLSLFPVTANNVEEYRYGYARLFPYIPIKINPKCLAARFFVVSGYYEISLTKSILKRQGILVDIGANYGYYSSLWLANNSENSVIAVEPIKEYVKLLEENLSVYSPRYHIYNGCIGNDNKEVLMDTMGEATMLSKIVPDSDTSNSSNLVSSTMITLNSLMKNYGLQRIDVLKIDAEGYDIAILESAKNLFLEHRIKTVYWEGTKENSKNIISFLEKYGYQLILDQEAIAYELITTDQ